MDNYSVYTSVPKLLKVGDTMLAETPDGLVKQILWPKHCVWHTEGVQLWPTLHRPLTAVYTYKGTEPTIECYSVFGNPDRDYCTGLHDLLQGFGVDSLYFAGVAEDVCVGQSALAALALGYQVTVIEDATCGVSVEDTASMKEAILKAGGEYLHSDMILT